MRRHKLPRDALTNPNILPSAAISSCQSISSKHQNGETMETPVYIFTGLLESGKTTLIQEVIKEEDFLEPGNTVLIQCEDGEESFSKELCDAFSISIIQICDWQEMSESFWQRIEKKYAPAQILIEYNGMWEMEQILSGNVPQDWYTGGIYSTVNAETAEIYMTNMRKNFMEPLRNSNLIIINRCDESTDRLMLRRAIKLLNPQAQIAFEGKDGKMLENETGSLPFDYSKECVVIEDMDYGLWYIDAVENPEHYMEKEICFTGRYCASANPAADYFIPGRHVMTCCEDDIQFLGFICYFDRKQENSFKHGQWANVKVRFEYGTHEMYGGEQGPVLWLLEISAAKKPAQELVTLS